MWQFLLPSASFREGVRWVRPRSKKRFFSDDVADGVYETDVLEASRYCARQHTSAYVSITSAYATHRGIVYELLPPRIRQHTSAYASIRQHYVSIRDNERNSVCSFCLLGYVSIRQHTSALRQHTPAYVSIRL
jgi:hypothetical protein